MRRSIARMRRSAPDAANVRICLVDILTFFRNPSGNGEPCRPTHAPTPLWRRRRALFDPQRCSCSRPSGECTRPLTPPLQEDVIRLQKAKQLFICRKSFPGRDHASGECHEAAPDAPNSRQYASRTPFVIAQPVYFEAPWMTSKFSGRGPYCAALRKSETAKRIAAPRCLRRRLAAHTRKELPH